MPKDSYEELIYSLGDAAYERLWNKPDRPRTIDRVIKAAEAYEQRQLELRELEATMDAEEASYLEFRQACEEESAQCREVIERFKKPVQLAESKAKALEAKLVAKRKDVFVARQGLARLEAQIANLEAIGDLERAAKSKAPLKHAKLDAMKRAREADEMQAEYDKIMNPSSGPGAEGIRARRREKDLEMQLEERTEGYNEQIAELNELAAAKDEEVRAAQEYYEQALMLLGEEVYTARISDAALAPFYPKIDRVAR